MSKHKAVYLMAGGRSSRGRGFDPVMQAVRQEISVNQPTIAYVGVASGDDHGFFNMIGETLKKAIDCKLAMAAIAAKKANLNRAREVLSAADAIFMSGGDVEAGMQVLAEKGLIEFLQQLFREGKLFFGASAGSIMLAREWVRWKNPEDDTTAELFPCLGIADVICDTHAEADDWEELRAALQLKSEGAVGFGIPTGSCLVVGPAESAKALGGPVARYIRENSRAKKMPDLGPD